MRLYNLIIETENGTFFDDELAFTKEEAIEYAREKFDADEILAIACTPN